MKHKYLLSLFSLIWLAGCSTVMQEASYVGQTLRQEFRSSVNELVLTEHAQKPNRYCYDSLARVVCYHEPLPPNRDDQLVGHDGLSVAEWRARYGDKTTTPSHTHITHVDEQLAPRETMVEAPQKPKTNFNTIIMRPVNDDAPVAAPSAPPAVVSPTPATVAPVVAPAHTMTAQPQAETAGLFHSVGPGARATKSSSGNNVPLPVRKPQF